MATLIKWVLVLGLLSGGTLFLAHGIGIETPLAAYKGSQGSGIPVGLALFAAGVALAAFWKTDTNTSREGLDSATSFDGHSSGSRKIVKVERRFDKPQ